MRTAWDAPGGRPPRRRPPNLVAARSPARPQGDAGHTEPAEEGAVNLGLRVPTRPRRSPGGRIRGAPLDDAVTESSVPALIELGVEVKPTDTAAAVLRHPRETHPRSPERAALTGPRRPFPAAMVAAPRRTVYYRHDFSAGGLHKSEYVTYAASGSREVTN
jgi:hypothetical protein